MGQAAAASRRRDAVVVALLCVMAGIGYYWMSRPFGGPAYLADEVGYLSNAAFIAGHASHGGSSYYAGYSLAIAPLFLLFSDPGKVWTGVLALNALMWTSALFLVSGLLERFHAGTPLWKRVLVLVVMALYPAYIAMSGYAFSQSMVALLFATAIATLTWLRVQQASSVLPHAVTVGYLCSVHPVGFAVAAASLLVMAALAWRTRRWATLTVALVIIGGSAGVYHLLIHPWLVVQMTPTGAPAALHYPSLSSMLRLEQLRQQALILLGMSLGQLCYIVLATFGFVGLGLVYALQNGWSALGRVKQDAHAVPAAAVLLVAALTLFGIIAESALASALATGPDRVDQWIYGRYLEPVVMLLLGLGLLSPARKGWVLSWALLTVLVGVLLVHVVKMDGDLYVMNVPALWPRYTNWATEPMGWFLLGAGGIVFAALINRMLAMLLMMGIYVSCLPSQHEWHSRILSLNSNPSDLTEFIATNYSPGQCVGFDVTSSAALPVNRQERANLYSFYLFDSPLLRLTPAQWLAQCEGPLLTFDSTLKLPGTQYVGREKASKLYVLVKKRSGQLIFPNSEPAEQEWLDAASDERCMLAGCFQRQGGEFARHHGVGRVSAEGIATDGRAGFLSFGPYAFLSAGNYLLELEGSFPAVDGTRVDVTAGGDGAMFTDVSLKAFVDADRRLARIPFELPQDTSQVEVRIRVAASDELQLKGYRVLVNDTTLRSKPVPALLFQGSQLGQLPHQVGEASEMGIATDGRAGFLLYGPYKTLRAGRYELRLEGISGVASSAWVDIVSDAGRSTHFRASIPADREGFLVEPVVVDMPSVENLEVRVHVGGGDQVKVSSYSLSRLGQ